VEQSCDNPYLKGQSKYVNQPKMCSLWWSKKINPTQILRQLICSKNMEVHSHEILNCLHYELIFHMHALPMEAWHFHCKGIHKVPQND
jgi:hypothetical protein